MTFSVRLFAKTTQPWSSGRSVWFRPANCGWMAIRRSRTASRSSLSYTSFDDEVTVSAPSTWQMWWPGEAVHLGRRPGVWLGGCGVSEEPVGARPRRTRRPGRLRRVVRSERRVPLLSAPADAAAIAQEVIADPNFETTAPVAPRVGGLESVSIDVALTPGGKPCGVGMIDISRWVHTTWGGIQGLRLRLYLVDLPEGMSVETLAITVVAPEERFEEFIEETEPIIESISSTLSHRDLQPRQRVAQRVNVG